MTQDTIWQTKLAARTHDPAEKALVLLRDPAGRQDGTSRALHRRLQSHSAGSEMLHPDSDEALSNILFRQGIPTAIYRQIQRADWWAAAADRPQWPMEEIAVTTTRGQRTLQVAPWAQVHWTKRPILIHPLTGDQFNLPSLSDTEIDDIKQRCSAHFVHLQKAIGASESVHAEQRKLLFAYWRFGPELAEGNDGGKLANLWRLLPGDTRVPDHSIWDHLDLTSAFAGAFAADTRGEASLLALSIGPVQSFIASARSTSDLWAGSHLLSRLAWEAMRPICEDLGPDAILFPRLRGVPQVDLWLQEEGLPATLFKDCAWAKGGGDSNPLFSAALPNRFVAVVPTCQAKTIAEKVQDRVRQWLQELGQDVVKHLLEAAGLANDSEQVCHQQMYEQLAGFPEVHWAAVPFSLVTAHDQEQQTELDAIQLSAAMAPFFGAQAGETCGFLDTSAWKVLQKPIHFGSKAEHQNPFFSPNPGVLYPAIYELAERVMAAAKSVRSFKQSRQAGWRCSLTGETEWLATDRQHLQLPPGSQADTLWSRIARKRKTWAKPGERLSALPAIKRLWPTLFAKEVARTVNDKSIDRFVVSTHTMALARHLDQWLELGGLTLPGLKDGLDAAEPVALPRRLMRKHAMHPALADAKRLPWLLDQADESGDEQQQGRIQRQVRQLLAQGSADGTEPKLEAYYGLIMMDGDRMGQLLAGESSNAITYLESFHPSVREGFRKHCENNPALSRYGSQKRALSPGRHLAISGALNDFSLTIVQHVVEDEYTGRVIYAGGDDVLAMLSVTDILPAMQRLRHAYSGAASTPEGNGDPRSLTLSNGFALLDGRLMRMMGTRASASCGAVIAHHQAPLSLVRRELEAAEKRAKQEGGRDAFSLTILKRSGGTLRLTASWGDPITLLVRLRNFLSRDGVSRRAVYNTLEWLVDLPEPRGNSDMLASLLAYQIERQADATARQREDIPGLTRQLAELAVMQAPRPLEWLQNFLSVAEFLAREARSGESE